MVGTFGWWCDHRLQNLSITMLSASIANSSHKHEIKMRPNAVVCSKTKSSSCVYQKIFNSILLLSLSIHHFSFIPFSVYRSWWCRSFIEISLCIYLQFTSNWPCILRWNFLQKKREEKINLIVPCIKIFGTHLKPSEANGIYDIRLLQFNLNFC